MLSFQRKSEHYVTVVKKAKHIWGVKIARIMFVAHAQIQFVWNISQKLSKDYTMWFLQKVTDILCEYHVDQASYWMLKLCFQTTHFEFFFSSKSMSCIKTLFDFLSSQLTTIGLLRMQTFFSVVCLILITLLSSYFEVISFHLSLKWK